MNIQALKTTAHALRIKLDFYKDQDPAAAALYAQMEPWLNQAEHGQITAPVQWRDLHGHYLFTEEGLQQYQDLERAYAAFCIELTGGETPALRLLRQQMGEI